MAEKKQVDGKRYEMMVILRSTLSDSQRKEELEKIQAFIKEHGGSVTHEETWGKRSLAYLIKKEKEGYYIIYDILMPAIAADPLKKILNIDNNVLRFLLQRNDNAVTIPEKVKVKAKRS